MFGKDIGSQVHTDHKVLDVMQLAYSAGRHAVRLHDSGDSNMIGDSHPCKHRSPNTIELENSD